MNYDEEILRLVKELGLEETYPCKDCTREYELWCSNAQCVETLTRMKNDNTGNTDI